MDASFQAGITTYAWPSDVLTRLTLSPEDIGILAWNNRTLGITSSRMYLPLRMGSSSLVSHTPAISRTDEAYKIVLLSNVELGEVYITLYPVDQAGHKGRPILSNSKLDHGFYPADRPISFRIPFSELANARTEVFALSVGAELKNGNPRTAPEFTFYHPGPVPAPKP